MEYNFKKLFSPEIMESSPIVIAGPCSAESKEQVLATARQLSEAGIKIFRAGVWKPRTMPGGFEGIGTAALGWLTEAKAATGMLMATEVATPRHVREAVENGIDVLWIGARTSANPFAMQEIADALEAYPQEKKDSLAVLVKNPVNPDLELWIGALTRIYSAGIRRLGAIHRGFSSYRPHIYRNLPEWRIPIELHRRIPQLPIFCDPSHIGGKRELVAPLSQQALDMGFTGLIIESHVNPEAALSDSAQQVTPEALNNILQGLERRRATVSTENLRQLREQIDRCDDELLEVLANRMQIARDIGQYKLEHGMPVVQSERYADLMQKRVETAVGLNLSSDFIRHILAVIHEESVRLQVQICEKGMES